MTISTIVVAITDVFGEGGGVGGFPPKDEKVLNKWLNRLADGLKVLAGKDVKALPVVVGSAVGDILRFLSKVVRFVAEHTWALIAFVAELIVAWLMQRLSRKQTGKVGWDQVGHSL